MKAPSFAAVFKDGAWTCAYVGDDGGKAQEAYKHAINVEKVGAMLFIRPSYTRRCTPQAAAAHAPKPSEVALSEPKSKKGGK